MEEIQLPNRNTTLESTGAEFFVLSLLLTQGIEAYKSYVNQPGYDLVAVYRATGRTCRIQVKCRTAKKAPKQFLIDNLGSDVVVHVRLNRVAEGEAWSHTSPDVWVLPIQVVERAADPRSKLGKVRLSQIGDLEAYRDAWHVIRAHLENRSTT